MPRGRPVDEETRDAAINLMTDGKGRNAIARELGISAGAVTKIANEIGHEFNWAVSELAMRAANIENGVLRASLARAALLRAHEALESMDAPTEIVQWQAGTPNQDSGWMTYILPVPTATDQRNYATIFGILVQRASELMRSVEGAANYGAVSHLEELSASLLVAAEALKRQHEGAETDPDDPTAEPTMVTREALLLELGDDPGDGDDDERSE